MKFARIVDRANRQILLTTSWEKSEDCFVICIETHYSGENFFSLDIGNFKTRKEAYDAMMKLSEDDIVLGITGAIDKISEDEEE